MKTTKIKYPVMFPPRLGHAGKDYTCDGCGEIPITKGSVMMTSVAKEADGTFHRAHYCIRCTIVIQAKKFHRKDHTAYIEPGSLKLNRLSNQFRKAWTDYKENLKAMPDASQAEIRKLAHNLFVDLGMDFRDFCLGGRKK